MAGPEGCKMETNNTYAARPRITRAQIIAQGFSLALSGYVWTTSSARAEEFEN
jgi:hypothetical protein